MIKRIRENLFYLIADAIIVAAGVVGVSAVSYFLISWLVNL